MALNGWKYKREIAIDNTQNNNTLTNYQICVVLNTYELINTNKMTASGTDVRFLDSDDSTLLNYWIENIPASGTKFWVKIPTISGSSSKTIYMYYGNPSASGVSTVSGTFIRELDNVVAAFEFNEDGGHDVLDSSGNSYDGVLEGPVRYKCAYDCVEFDGSNDYIKISDGPSIMSAIDSSNKISVCCRMKPKANVKWFFMYGVSGDPENNFELVINSSNKLYLFWEYGSGSNYSTTSTGTITLDVLQHIAVTAKYNSVNFYKNGLSIGSTSSTAAFWSKNSDRDLIIGAYDSTPSDRYFKGLIGEYYIFSDILSAGEVSDIANNKLYIPSNYISNKALIRSYSYPEPTVFVGNEIEQVCSFRNKLKFIILTSLIEENLTHFPITLFLTDDNASEFFNELDVILNDDFSGYNGTFPNNMIWSVLDGSPTINNNKLRFNLSGDDKDRISSRYKLVGDFDIQVNFDVITGPSTKSWVFEIRIRLDNGKRIGVARGYGEFGSSKSHKYFIDEYNGTSWVYPAQINTTDTNGKLRLVRTGDDFKCYYWNGSSWSQLGSSVTLGSDDCYIDLLCDNYGSYPSVTIDADDFRVNSGAVTWPNGHPYQKKIAVYNDSETLQLYVEIEKWDFINREVVLHVSRDNWTIYSTDNTYIYLYFDKEVEDNTSYVGNIGEAPATNVWDSNFKCVFHLCQDPSGGTNSIKDSTSNHNDGSPYSMSSNNLVVGKIGKALSFDGSNDYIRTQNISLSTPITVESVFNYDSQYSCSTIVANADAGVSSNGFDLYVNSWQTSNRRLVVESGDDSSGSTIAVEENVVVSNVWSYGAAIINGSNSKLIFNDKVVLGTLVNFSTSDNISIGVMDNDLCYFDGSVDEVRISSIARSEAWVKATYYSLFGYLVYRCDTMDWLYGYRNRLKFRIDHTKIDENLVHFPVTVFLNEDNANLIFDEIGTNYKKIAVTTDDGLTQLYVEVEKWDIINKEAVLHISADFWVISSETDTYFYIYYDNTVNDNIECIGDVGDTIATHVWNAKYKCVWHLSQSPTGGTDCIKDSTFYNRDLTPQGSMTFDDLVDSKVGKALDFDGSDDYLRGSDWFYSNVLTVEAVFKVDTISGSNRLCLKRNIGIDANADEWELWVGGTSLAFAGWSSTSTVVYVNSGSDAIQANTWYYAAGKCDGSNAYLYLNNEQKEVNEQIGSLQNSTSEIQVGCRSNNDSSQYMNGLIDEVRISNTARSDAWIKATYYSLFNELVYSVVDTYYFIGKVYEFNRPVSRQLYLYNRDNGKLLNKTISTNNGEYYLTTTYSGAHFIVCLDAPGGEEFNDLIIGNASPFKA